LGFNEEVARIHGAAARLTRGGGISGEVAAEAARVRDVEVVPLRRFYRGAMARDGLQLGFAAVSAREIRRRVDEIARAPEACRG
jgi:GntR family transcriptional regulator/MocR family aminotransferase